jgi:hypothetical protein
MLGLVGGADSSRRRVPVERLDGAPERTDIPEPGALSVAVEPGTARCCSTLTLLLNGALAATLSRPHGSAGERAFVPAFSAPRWNGGGERQGRDNAAQHGSRVREAFPLSNCPCSQRETYTGPRRFPLHDSHWRCRAARRELKSIPALRRRALARRTRRRAARYAAASSVPARSLCASSASAARHTLLARAVEPADRSATRQAVSARRKRTKSAAPPGISGSCWHCVADACASCGVCSRSRDRRADSHTQT